MTKWFFALMLFATSAAVWMLAPPPRAQAEAALPTRCFYCWSNRCGRGTLGGAACAVWRCGETEICCQEWGWCEVW